MAKREKRLLALLRWSLEHLLFERNIYTIMTVTAFGMLYCVDRLLWSGTLVRLDTRSFRFVSFDVYLYIASSSLIIITCSSNQLDS